VWRRCQQQRRLPLSLYIPCIVTVLSTGVQGGKEKLEKGEM